MPVLIVEFDYLVRTAVEEIPTEDGYAVLSAFNGQRALDVITSRSPGLILLDLRMPIMHGWTFARERGSQIPFVVTTADQ